MVAMAAAVMAGLVIFVVAVVVAIAITIPFATAMVVVRGSGVV